MAAGTNSFFITDRNSGNRYLVDTGAELSVIPATEWDRKGHQGEGLKAANQTIIKTYGKRTIMLRFGESRFEHTFIIADVPNRMIGIDFTDANGLSIDTPNRELFVRETNATICAVTKEDKVGDPELFKLLDKFPSILTPNFKNKENKHRIEHYIQTSGHPVFSKPRRLDQAKLEAAKAEFAELERLGIIRRSDSPWSSPCLLYTSPSPRDKRQSRMPSSA